MRKLLSLAFIAFALTGPVSYACDLADIVTKGATDRSVALDIIDSTDGTPETGVVFNTSGIDLFYRREGAAVTTITEATLAALTTAHTDGGFLTIRDGSYRLDLPDAAWATGANYVDIGGTVTGMVVICQRVRLIDANLEVANIPANAIQVNGTNQTGRDLGASVLISSGTGTGQLSVTSGVIASNITQAGGSAISQTGGLLNANATQVSGDGPAADALEAAFDGTPNGARLFGIERMGTAQSATGTTLVVDSAAAYADNALVGQLATACGSTQGYCMSLPVASNVGSTDTLTLDGTWPVTPSGTIYFQLTMTSSSNIDTDLASIQSDTDNIQTRLPTSLVSGRIDSSTGAMAANVLTDAATASDVTIASVTGSVGSVTGAVGSVTGAVGSVTGNVGGSVASVTTVTDKTGYRLSATGVDDVWDEDATGHQTQGTFGQVLGDSAADSDSIWALVNTNVNATISSRASQTSVDDVPTNAELATALGTADDAVLSALTALPTTIRDMAIDDQGPLSLGCALAAMASYTSGDIDTTGSTSVYEESTGTETRMTLTILGGGDRTTVITCPTY